MNYLKANLLGDVVGTYDQTKTTIQGRVASKNISGLDVLGAPVTDFIDVFTDSGLTPTGTLRVTANNRLFVCGTVSAGQIPILLYDFNLTTGASAYIGRINVTTPNTAATTHTIRSLRVANDSTDSGWKLFLTTTGTITINGGTFLVNSIDKTDFTPGGTTIAFANGTDQKAVYLLQDPANIGVGQLQIASVGSTYDPTADRLYVHNGVSATHQYYVYNTATSPTYTNVASLVISDVSDTVADPGHTYLVNDPVLISSLSGGAGLTNNTVYFVRAPVAGVSYQLSATSGGAVINITTAGTATVGRAFGTTGSNFVHKTGNLPVLTGTLLATDSEEFAVPVSSPINGGVLNGNNCVFLATSSALYLGLLSQLTSGAVVWASLSTSNVLGAVNEVTSPTPSFATWSNTLDSATFVTNTSKFITKQLQNSVIISKTGTIVNDYHEGMSISAVDFGLTAVAGTEDEGGWYFIMGNTVGQRGIVAIDFRSDTLYDYSYIVSPVLDNPNSLFQFTTTWEALADFTGNAVIQYRTSGFGSISGGWIDMNAFSDLSALVSGNSVQFKISFAIQSEESSSPAQINELFIGVDANNGISSNWEFSDDFSDNTSPSRTAFRLKLVYTSAVPTLYYRAYDLSDALLVNHNSVTNAANFEYSTDVGNTWLPLGTIPNTVGTLVRYTFTSPPGVDIRPGLKES